MPLTRPPEHSPAPSEAGANTRRRGMTRLGLFVGIIFILLAAITALTANPLVLYICVFIPASFLVSELVARRALASLGFTWKFSQAVVGKEAIDELEIVHSGPFPLFNLDFFENSEAGTRHLIRIPYLAGKGRLKLKIPRQFAARGLYQWHSMFIQSSFPLGLWGKSRVYVEPGHRLVWPKPASRQELAAVDFQRALGGSGEVIEGEVREFTEGDSERDIIWTLSAKREKRVVRVRSLPKTLLNLKLNTTVSGPTLEFEISRLAALVYRLASHEAVFLKLETSAGPLVYRGKYNVLDQLALVKTSVDVS